jgi:creatinine amidohydrolase
MELAGSSTAGVAAYLTRSAAVVVPLGSTEQHGALAPVDCDAAVVSALCRESSSRAGVLCTPALPYGSSECHMSFPGTVSLSDTTLAAVIEDVAGSLIRHGFRSILLLSGHGGNRAASSDAVERLRSRHPGIDLAYMGYWELPGAKDLEERLFEGRSGYHATASEVSMYMHLFPGFRPPEQAMVQYPPSPSGRLSASGWRDAFPDGPAGVDARQASSEKGAEMFAFLCTSLAGVLDGMARGSGG